eukprot:2192096-Rhodomonas_salina.1
MIRGSAVQRPSRNLTDDKCDTTRSCCLPSTTFCQQQLALMFPPSLLLSLPASLPLCFPLSFPHRNDDAAVSSQMNSLCHTPIRETSKLCPAYQPLPVVDEDNALDESSHAAGVGQNGAQVLLERAPARRMLNPSLMLSIPGWDRSVMRGRVLG